VGVGVGVGGGEGETTGALEGVLATGAEAVAGIVEAGIWEGAGGT